MTLFKRLMAASIVIIGLASCSSDPIVETSEESTFTDRRPNVDGYIDGEPAWFNQKKTWYEWDYLIDGWSYRGTVHASQLTQGTWKFECFTMGNDCHDIGMITASPEGGTRIVIGRHNAVLNVKLLEHHITPEEFFSKTETNDFTIAAFDKMRNYVSFDKEALISDPAILALLNMPAGQHIVIAAGDYPIDYSSSEFGTVHFPFQVQQ